GPPRSSAFGGHAVGIAAAPDARDGPQRGNMKSLDVVITGGGFTGLALAAALADGRREIVVLEARTWPDPRFRGELIHPPGVRDLDALGFLGALRRAGGTEVRGFAVVPERARAAVRLPYEPPPEGSGN